MCPDIQKLPLEKALFSCMLCKSLAYKELMDADDHILQACTCDISGLGFGTKHGLDAFLITVA